MECISNCIFEFKNFVIFYFKDFVILVLSFSFTILWTLFLYRLKPNLSIESVDLAGEKLRVKVQNKGKSDAVNLKIEACAISDSYTHHLKIDKNDFIILPYEKGKQVKDTSHERIFKIDNIEESAKKYEMTYKSLLSDLKSEKNNYQIRIRIHASHEFSGFGKAFESIFKFENKKFIKIK